MGPPLLICLVEHFTLTGPTSIGYLQPVGCLFSLDQGQGIFGPDPGLAQSAPSQDQGPVGYTPIPMGL